MSKKRDKAPEDVFTPRSSKVNTQMYVPRPVLEKALLEAVRGSLNIVVHGESGSGKSWLYKKALADADITYLVANLANAARLGSIAAELTNLLSNDGSTSRVSFTETKRTQLSAVFASGELEHEATFTIGQKEPYEACLDKLRKRARQRRALLVLDNLEAVFDRKNLLDELANMIVLLDDERYASYDVKLLIVGVPKDLRRYYSRTPNLTTVANRLYELPEVSRLTRDQCRMLVIRGFRDELRYGIQASEIVSITTHVEWVTDRLPQRVHEYCLELARIGAENARTLRAYMLDEADRRWLASSLYSTYTQIEAAMNERTTKVGRRNQTLFVLGSINAIEFRATDVEVRLREVFEASTKGKSLNVAAILTELAGLRSPIVEVSPKGDCYVFRDPLFRMCIRAMLRRRDDRDTVDKIDAVDLARPDGR